MIRSAARLVLALAVVTAIPSVAAADTPDAGAPAIEAAGAGDPAVIPMERWMRERETGNGKSLNVLLASYSALQALDMYSTIAARENGAREVNPLMNTGYTQAVALKAGMSAVTYLAMRTMGKRHRKAAVVTMVILNGVTAAVVANNMKNAGR